MKVALAQINTTVGALQANTHKVIAHLEKARQAGAELVLFPELAITGYPPMDLLDHPRLTELNLECLEQIRAATQGLTAIVGFVDRNPGVGKPFYNAAAILQNGELRSVHHKTLLPTYDVFDEERYFEPARSVQSIDLLGQRVGVTICEDIWNDSDFFPRRMYQQDPIEQLAQQGIKLMLNISASPFHRGKPQIRLDLVQSLARKYALPFIYLNQVGGNDSLIFDGHSFIVNAQGQLLWLGKGFEEQFMVVDTEQLTPVDDAFETDMGMIEKALVLGVKDYMGKSGFKSAVLGLSGGIDSAVTAVIAAKALGPENVLGVAMPSQYSSQGSVDDAEALAINLGLQYKQVPIRPIFDSFKDALGPLFEGRAEDVTEENLQARIRGNLLMAMSNKFGHLLLTTGNKSEMAVGYCTLYGDMCGGLAVISDLPKTWVYQLAEYINRNQELIPRDTITKPPSAELRPNQKDQDSLPPYDVLDGILQAYVEGHKSHAEIVAMGYEAGLVDWVIRKINFNEYKRRQAPPGLKVTTKSFGPGRRYPIARGYDV